MGTVGAKQSPEFDNTNSPQYYNPDWMSWLDDSRSLANLSIPGTHNSVARCGGGLIQCQSWALWQQYAAGVRFVDIRPRHFFDRLPIHHGMAPLNTNLTKVLRETAEYLDEHPGEIIIMRIKPEHVAEGNTENFEQTLKRRLNTVPAHRLFKPTQDYPQRVPTVGEARGKIVILQQFAGMYYGIPWGSCQVEDKFNVASVFVGSIDGKFNSIVYGLQQAEIAQNKDDKLHITFCSGTSVGAHPNAVAERINPKVYDIVKTYKKRWGIVVFDYPGYSILEEIIQSNDA